MSASASPRIDELIDGRYVVERPLGEGGMGTVYLARHVLTGRRVALKWVESDDGSLRQRLLREARAIAKVSHRSVVDVLDAGEHGAGVYIVLEYLSGKSLRAYVDGRALAPSEAIPLLMPALEGVAAAHQQGILHRDLKPENLFVCLDGSGAPFDTKVLDFGVSKQVESKLPKGTPKQTALTQTGHIVGTPQYMAPEQIANQPQLDERTDVYAMALVLYELLTGRLPYATDDLRSVLLEILRGELPSPSRFSPELPSELCRVVMTALHPQADQRYASIEAFGRALAPWDEGRHFEAPRAPSETLDEIELDRVMAKPGHRSGAMPRGGSTVTKVEPGQATASLKPARRAKPNVSPVATAKTERAPTPIAVRAPVRAPVTQASVRVPYNHAGRPFLIAGLVALALAGAWLALRRTPAPEPTHVATPIEAAPVAAPAAATPSVAPPAPQPASAVTAQPTPAPAVAPAPNPVEAARTAEPVAPAEAAQAPAKSKRKRTTNASAPAPAEAAPRTGVEVKTRGGVFGAKDF